MSSFKEKIVISNASSQIEYLFFMGVGGGGGEGGVWCRSGVGNGDWFLKLSCHEIVFGQKISFNTYIVVCQTMMLTCILSLICSFLLTVRR